MEEENIQPQRKPDVNKQELQKDIAETTVIDEAEKTEVLAGDTIINRQQIQVTTETGQELQQTMQESINIQKTREEIHGTEVTQPGLTQVLIY